MGKVGMTRFAQDTVIACPACGRPTRLNNLRSLNTYGTRQWSDGYWEGLMGTRPALTRCVCECIYWLKDADVLGRYPQVQEEQRGLTGLLRRWFKPDDTEHNPVNIPRGWEWARHAEKLDLRNMLGVLRNSLPPDREYTVRRHIWHQLNDAERAGRDAYPHEAELIRQYRQQNLERLLALMEGTENPILLQRGEILRELGRFDEAIDIFNTIQGESQSWAERLRSEAEQGNTRVVVREDHG